MKRVRAASLRGRRATAPETVASARTAPSMRASRGRRGAAATVRIVPEAAAPAPAAESVQHTPTRSATARAVRQERNLVRAALDTPRSLRAKRAGGETRAPSVDEAAAELAHDCVLLDPGRCDGDLAPDRPVRARDDNGLHAPQGRQVRHEANCPADSRAAILVFTPHGVHGLSRDRDPAARRTGNLDHASRVRMGSEDSGESYHSPQFVGDATAQA